MTRMATPNGREQEGQDQQGHNVEGGAGSDGKAEGKVTGLLQRSGNRESEWRRRCPHIVTIDTGDGDLAVCKLKETRIVRLDVGDGQAFG